MNWRDHKATWPHSDHSSFVNVRPHRWHVQDMGQGAVILMLHGAGASTHSYRHLMPVLARTHRVIAVDMPGHGFTYLGAKSRAGLEPIAEDLLSLLAHLDVAPEILVGHSAGGAVAARLALDLPKPPKQFIAINGAFEMFDGLAGWAFPMMAKVLSLNPLTGPLFALTMTQSRTDQMLGSTGSAIDAEGRRLYHILTSDKAHVEGTLAMMSNWRLNRLTRDLPTMPCPTLMLVGGKDDVVPPEVARRAAAMIPGARIETRADLGHLMHEEDPDWVAGMILAHEKGRPAPA